MPASRRALFLGQALLALMPADSLNQAHRVLYMTHLAIGDFVYQGPHLQALQQAYPNIQLDIWIDDLRGTSKTWHQGRNTTLCQWLEDQPFINHIYPIAANNSHRQALIRQAQERDYDAIIFIATQRSDLFAKAARAISRSAYIVGTQAKGYQNPLGKWWRFRQINGVLDESRIPDTAQQHISSLYGHRFQALVGVKSEAATLAVSPPAAWRQRTRQRLDALDPEGARRWVLINHLSTSVKRDLSWSKTLELIKALHKRYPALSFVLNLPPDQFQAVEERLHQQNEEYQDSGITILPFTATEHFYELPAMLCCVDYVVTVETAIMHLAASVGTRQTALVRASATHWQPLGDSQVVECQGSIDAVDVAVLVARVIDHWGLLSP